MQIEPIGYARNGFCDKFGIPRQARKDSVLETRIELVPPYDDPNALRGIEGYSHLWLIWEFSEADSAWRATVRPPRLGGNERMGVFATRSPFRPNRLGLTSVELLRIEDGVLVVRGADLLDGTPIYDIKPYLSFTDSHPEARNGFAGAHETDGLEVEWDVEIADEAIRAQVTEIISQDPRPGYHDDPAREYKMDYGGWRVAFCVADGVARVVSAEKC